MRFQEKILKASSINKKNQLSIKKRTNKILKLIMKFRKVSGISKMTRMQTRSMIKRSSLVKPAIKQLCLIKILRSCMICIQLKN